MFHCISKVIFYFGQMTLVFHLQKLIRLILKVNPIEYISLFFQVHLINNSIKYCKKVMKTVHDLSLENTQLTC